MPRTSAEASTAACAAIFGDSDSCSEAESDADIGAAEALQRVPGLSVLPGFLSVSEQARLLTAIADEPWFRRHRVCGPVRDQAMIFGYDNFPPWALKLAERVRCAATFPLAIRERAPLFDQIIVNVYAKGDFIRPHVDQLQYDDGIASISLCSACDMPFERSSEVGPEDVGTRPHAKEVLLRAEPGMLLTMHGAARYAWRHSISGVSHRRVSITFRRFLPLEQRPRWRERPSPDASGASQGQARLVCP
jgi:alkylated DNA repair dioxygenase AlkB